MRPATGALDGVLRRAASSPASSAASRRVDGALAGVDLRRARRHLGDVALPLGRRRRRASATRDRLARLIEPRLRDDAFCSNSDCCRSNSSARVVERRLRLGDLRLDHRDLRRPLAPRRLASCASARASSASRLATAAFGFRVVEAEEKIAGLRPRRRADRRARRCGRRPPARHRRSRPRHSPGSVLSLPIRCRRREQRGAAGWREAASHGSALPRGRDHGAHVLPHQRLHLGEERRRRSARAACGGAPPPRRSAGTATWPIIRKTRSIVSSASGSSPAASASSRVAAPCSRDMTPNRISKATVGCICSRMMKRATRRISCGPTITSTIVSASSSSAVSAPAGIGAAACRAAAPTRPRTRASIAADHRRRRRRGKARPCRRNDRRSPRR